VPASLKPLFCHDRARIAADFFGGIFCEELLSKSPSVTSEKADETWN